MAFPTGSSFSLITIDNTKVSGSVNLTNFPVLINSINIPSSVYAAMQGDGDDIRFTTDLAGTTEVPFEIVSLDSGAETCEIWVKIPTVDYNDDTEFYMWYGDATLVAYAASATYGSEAVWTGYNAVYHLEGNSNDSSSVGLNATDSNVSYGTSYGKLGGQGGSFNGTSSTFLSSTRPFNLPSNLTISGWFYLNNINQICDFFGINGGASAYGYSLKMRDPSSESAGNSLFIVMPGKANHDTGYDFPSTGWYHITLRRTGGVWTATVNKSNKTTTSSTPYSPDQSMAIGSGYFGSPRHYMNGYSDEVKFIDAHKSDDWMDTEYDNQNSPTTFLTIAEASIGATGNMLLAM